MTHGEQRLWLIQQLLNERNDAAGVQIPEDEQGQKDLLRGLMNIRMPDPIDAEFLRIQDEYLTEENLAEGVVKIEDLTPIKADNRLYIWQRHQLLNRIVYGFSLPIPQNPASGSVP